MWGTPGVQGPLGGVARGDDHLPPPVGELWDHSNLLHMAGIGEEEGDSDIYCTSFILCINNNTSFHLLCTLARSQGKPSWSSEGKYTEVLL